MQGMMSDNTQKLTSAVSSLPALLEKKRKIDMHMSMATSVLEQVIPSVKLLSMRLIVEQNDYYRSSCENWMSSTSWRRRRSRPRPRPRSRTRCGSR